MQNIDVELLIRLVEKRPVIWNKNLDVYKNKVLREAAWREICVITKKGFLEMARMQRQDYDRTLRKKWTQIRDSWCKDYKKKKYLPKSACVKSYKYCDRLAFLIKAFETAVEPESGETNEGEEEPVYEERMVYSTEDTETARSVESEGEAEESRGISSTETDTNLLFKSKKIAIDDKTITFHDNVTNEQEDEDANSHLHFFKSLLPVTSSLNVDETLEFQAGVINLLQSIKRKRLDSSYQNTGVTTTYFHQNTDNTASQDNAEMNTYQSPPAIPTDDHSPASDLEVKEELLEYTSY